MQPPPLPRRRRLVVVTAIALLAVIALALAFWYRRFHRYTPAELVQDVRAGIAAHTAPRPVEKFLELRYGPLDAPANRERAFLDFFNVGHIEGLHLITSRMPAAERPARIAEMAQWIANFRESLTPQQQRDLAARFNSEEGRQMVQAATARYLSQDVHYRAETAPVIAQLMTTLAALQKP